MNTVLFDLRAVVDYPVAELRACLYKAIQNVLDVEPEAVPHDGITNNSAMMLEVFLKSRDRFPTDEEYDKVKWHFKQLLKAYFLTNEELYQARPGVQNIFAKLRGKDNWNFYVLSDYWKGSTRFILESCGIYTKRLNIMAAELALDSEELVKKVLRRQGIGKNNMTYWVTDSAGSNMDENGLKVINTNSLIKGASGFFAYPKFKKLFAQEEEKQINKGQTSLKQ